MSCRAVLLLQIASLLALAAARAAAGSADSLPDPTAHLSAPPAIIDDRGGHDALLRPLPEMDRTSPPPANAAPSCAESDPAALPCRHRESGRRR